MVNPEEPSPRSNLWGWMDGWMDGRKDKWMDGWMDLRRERLVGNLFKSGKQSTFCIKLQHSPDHLQS